MGKRRVDAVILCEDVQHASFFHRLLKRTGRFKQPRTVPYPAGAADAKAHVKGRFAEQARRQRRRPSTLLLTAMDADNRTVQQRYDELLGELDRPRGEDERIAVFIPKRNIETWIHYLLGKEPVDEETAYPKLDRPSDCHPGVDRLTELAQGALPDDCPPSLRRAITDECPRLR